MNKYEELKSEIQEIVDDYEETLKEVQRISFSQSFDLSYNFEDDSVEDAIEGCQAFEDIMRRLNNLLEKEEEND